MLNVKFGKMMSIILTLSTESLQLRRMNHFVYRQLFDTTNRQNTLQNTQNNAVDIEAADVGLVLPDNAAIHIEIAPDEFELPPSPPAPSRARIAQSVQDLSRQIEENSSSDQVDESLEAQAARFRRFFDEMGVDIAVGSQVENGSGTDSNELILLDAFDIQIEKRQFSVGKTKFCANFSFYVQILGKFWRLEGFESPILIFRQGF